MARLLDVLESFCADLGQGQHRFVERFIREVAFGALSARSLKLSDIARELNERTAEGTPRRLIHTEKRLSRVLNSDRLDCEAIRRRHLERATRPLRFAEGEGAVVIFDGSTLPKPSSRTELGRGAEGVSWVWDNNASRKVIGYPLAGVSAVSAAGARCPLLLQPYSHVQGDGQRQTFLDVLQSVRPFVGRRAWLVADRGLFGRDLCAGLDKQGWRWCIRVKLGGRAMKVMTRTGEVVDVKTLVERTLVHMRTERVVGRGRKRRVIPQDIARLKVRMRDKDGQATGPWRTLIAVWGERDEPLVLLASEWLRGKAEVLSAYRAWAKRFVGIETVFANAKSRRFGLDLNGVRVLKLRGVRRMLMLAIALLAFIETLCEDEGLTRRILRSFRSFEHMGSPDRPAQRVLRAASNVLQKTRYSELWGWVQGGAPAA